MNVSIKETNFAIKKEMKKIETYIEINAAQNQVWEVLTNFNLYPAWNPFIQKIVGDLAPEANLKTTIILNGKENHFTPVITALEEGEHFEWLGKGPLGMFNGRHYFKLEPVDANTTRLIHGEIFTGWAHRLILMMVGKNTELGFKAMNNALKRRVEKINA